MSSFDTIRNLTSFRNCDDDVIPRKKVGKILEAGRNAPSPGNVQASEFIVVEDDHKKELLAKFTGDDRADESPTVIIVLTDDDRMKRRVGSEAEKSCEAEASCAVQNMRIVAKEEGLSSCWISGFNSDEVRSSFKIPRSKTPRSLVVLGYSDDEIEPEHKFGLNEVCFYDEYGNQVRSKFDQLDWKGIREERRVYDKKAKGLKNKVKDKLSNVL